MVRTLGLFSIQFLLNGLCVKVLTSFGQDHPQGSSYSVRSSFSDHDNTDDEKQRIAGDKQSLGLVLEQFRKKGIPYPEYLNKKYAELCLMEEVIVKFFALSSADFGLSERLTDTFLHLIGGLNRCLELHSHAVAIMQRC